MGAMVLAHGKKTNTLYMTSGPRDTIVVVAAGTMQAYGTTDSVT